MTIKSSGSSLAFSEIEDEFGQNTPDRSLGAYRISQTIEELSNLPLDSGIPQSGQIKFSDFYSKSLNVVVDCFSGPTQTRIRAKNDKWNNDEVVIVGPRTTKKQSGSKIIIHVNKTFGSASSSNQNTCALRTGTWSGIVSLQIDMGSTGFISGAGGKGADGDDGVSNVGCVRKGASGGTHTPNQNAVKPIGSWNGGNGNSALGIQYSPTTVNVTKGVIQCGYGGGAAGRGSRSDNVSDRTACPGGGGGGAGYPGGAAGEGGKTLTGGEYEATNTGCEVDSGHDGGAGTLTTGGASGEGGNNDDESTGMDGGVGGDSEQSPGSPSIQTGFNNDNGNDNSSGWYQSNGTAGSNGAAIRRLSGYTVIINESGTGDIRGSKTATGVA